MVHWADEKNIEGDANNLTAGNLTNTFDVSRQKTLEFETTRHNYYTAAKMGGSDSDSIGGININQSGRKDEDKQAKNKTVDDLIYMSMINDLEAMELELERKYGENFAENLAAEHLDEQTYNEIMLIQDQDERRHQVAIELKRGIEDGTIDPNVLAPEFKDWIEVKALDAQQRANIDLQENTPIESASKLDEETHAIKNDENLSTGLSNILGR